MHIKLNVIYCYPINDKLKNLIEDPHEYDTF